LPGRKPSATKTGYPGAPESGANLHDYCTLADLSAHRRPAGASSVLAQDRGAQANLTTPKRLDRMGQRMQEHVARRQEAFARRASATKALYSALSPGQRRTMDALPLLRGGHREGGGKGRGHGMGDLG
jgi:LTXXQ motif family protein